MHYCNDRHLFKPNMILIYTEQKLDKCEITNNRLNYLNALNCVRNIYQIKCFILKKKKGISTGHEAWYMCDTFSYVSEQ